MSNQNEVEVLNIEEFSNNSISNVNIASTEVDVNIKSAGNLIFRFIVSYFILEVLVEFIFILLGVNKFFLNLPNFLGSYFDSYVYKLIIAFVIIFFYYFLYNLFVSMLAFRDTFLKKRVIAMENKTKFFVVVAIVFPIVINLLWYFLGIRELSITVIYMFAQILATCITSKKIKTF